MKILTWNINHRIRPKKIPPQMAEALASLKPDIIVLTEYVKGPDHGQFLKDLKTKGYGFSELSLVKEKQNSILVVSRTPLKPGTITGPGDIIPAVTCNVLHVIEDSGINVLALRMPLPMSAENKKKWWDCVTGIADENRHLPFIITGDFNTDPDVTRGPNGKIRFGVLRDNGWLLDVPPSPSWWNTDGRGSKLDHTLLSAAHFAGLHSSYLTGSGPFVFAGEPGAMSDHAVLLAEAERRDPEKNLDAIQAVFVRSFRDLKIPDENLRERKPGSIPWGSGRIIFVFGKEDGREYLEYYAHHRIGGDSHGKIFDDGEQVSLPELCSMFSFNPAIPGDEEKKQAEMEREYRETYEDLEMKGLLSAGLVQGSMAVNAHLVLNKEKK